MILKITGLTTLLMIFTLTSCDDSINDFDPNKDPLKGKIGGQDWEYTAGNGNYNPSFNVITGLFIAENAIDPCAIRATSNPHISFGFPARRGNYNLPTFNNSVYVVFNTQNGQKRLTASGGFLEIVAIDGRQAIGFLNATFDDDNEVQGTFGIEICN